MPGVLHSMAGVAFCWYFEGRREVGLFPDGVPTTGKGWHTAALWKGVDNPGVGGRQEGLLHTWPWSHQSNPEWMLPRITEESGDGSGDRGGHGWATAVPWGWSVGLLRAGAEGFGREEVTQEPTQTAGDGARALLTWLKPLDFVYSQSWAESS